MFRAVFIWLWSGRRLGEPPRRGSPDASTCWFFAPILLICSPQDRSDSAPAQGALTAGSDWSPMTVFELDSLDLAALLCSRVCHDVISPVGAIVNGLEVLEDEKDPEMREIALDLIKKSAATASARLQFCRLAFGAAGSAGASIDTGEAEKVVRGLFADQTNADRMERAARADAEEQGQADPQFVPDRSGRDPARRRRHGDGARCGRRGRRAPQRRGERTECEARRPHAGPARGRAGAWFRRRPRDPALLCGPRRADRPI